MVQLFQLKPAKTSLGLIKLDRKFKKKYKNII